jgi:hypothetical protein
MNNNYLQDWVFHFNVYTELWAAIPRETYNEYWNEPNALGVLKSKSLKTLQDLLHKTQGDPQLIEEVIKNGESK